MAAGTWKIYTRAKRLLCTGSILLSTTPKYMSLHKASASANILKVSNGGISTFASIGSEISARGNYTAGGIKVKVSTGNWTVGASTKQMKWTYTTIGLTFKASLSALNNIKYAAVRNSTGAGAGKVICYVTLSTAQFTISTGNTLTIKPATTGVFTLA